jgi:small conductance mechanosensitive channel
VVVEIQDFGESAIAYDVALWIPASDFLGRRWALRRYIWEEFRAAGVEMTYPHLNVHLDDRERNPQKANKE